MAPKERDNTTQNIIILSLVICFLAFGLLLYFGNKEGGFKSFFEDIFGDSEISTTTLMNNPIFTTTQPSLDSTTCLNDIKIYSGSYDTDKKTLSLTVNNMGGSIGGLKLYLYSGETLLREVELDEGLKGNSLQTLTIDKINVDFNKGKLETECPEVKLEFERQNGKIK